MYLLSCGGALLFIDSATLALINSVALLLISVKLILFLRGKRKNKFIPGVTFLLTLWLTEALASVRLASHQVTILEEMFNVG